MPGACAQSTSEPGACAFGESLRLSRRPCEPASPARWAPGHLVSKALFPCADSIAARSSSPPCRALKGSQERRSCWSSPARPRRCRGRPSLPRASPACPPLLSCEPASLSAIARVQPSAVRRRYRATGKIPPANIPVACPGAEAPVHVPASL